VIAKVLAGFLSALCLAGCTRVGTSSNEASGNPWTHHGLLRIVNLAEPDSLNPVIGAQQIDSELAQLWGGMLFNWTDKNELDPELATEVPTLANGGISKDGKTVVYHLRQGVLWHDGAPFGADDVIFTWHALMNKKNNVSSTVGYDLITSIDKRDEHTIAVHLKTAYAPFVATFFAPSGTPYPVLPKHLLARYDNINQIAYNSQPVGTGPYILDRWQRGNKIVFHANPHYWRGAPKLAEIWYTPVPNENTIVTLLQSHDADLEFRGTANNYAVLAHVPGYTTRLTPFTLYAQMALNLRSPQLADTRVRRALWNAIDVTGLIRDVTHGVDAPGDTDQPSFLWAYNPNVAHYPYDVAKAKAELTEAGWKPGADGIRTKNGQRLSIVIANVAGSATGNAVSVVVQRDWHDVGVEAIVKNYTSSLFFASYGAGGIVQTGKFDVAFYSWANGTDPDDSTLWMCDQFPPNGQNVFHYCNHALDAAERLALATSDRVVRKKAYDTIQELLARDVPNIIVWYERRISVANSDLQNYRPAHAVSSFWNAYSWVI
jgi:peptide/nickel transport system substrate-binding protein